MNKDRTGWEARNRRQKLNQEVAEYTERNAGNCCEFSVFVSLCPFAPVQIYDVRPKMKDVFLSCQSKKKLIPKLNLRVEWKRKHWLPGSLVRMVRTWPSCWSKKGTRFTVSNVVHRSSTPSVSIIFIKTRTPKNAILSCTTVTSPILQTWLGWFNRLNRTKSITWAPKATSRFHLKNQNIQPM